jgi:hypothetical protein
MLKRLTYVTAGLVIVFALVVIALLVFSSSKLANFLSTAIPAVPRIFLRCVKLFIVPIVLLVVIAFAAVVVAAVVGNTGYATTRDEAFRNLEPHSTACDIENGWSILALHDNDELKAIETDERWKLRFRCVLQAHSLSDENATDVNNPTTQDQPSSARAQPLRYYLGFIEFKEDGSPQSLVDDNDNPAYVSDSHGSLMLGQISVIEDHLKNHGSNFVVAFVHGWRHDTSIGDTNVRDARHYGAHVAKFLADRCEKYKQIEFCGVTVTVVYIGWRGARVDERKLQQHFGVVGRMDRHNGCHSDAV